MGEAAGGSPHTIDFYDVSYNFIASMSNEIQKVKEFRIISNIFPAAHQFWVDNTFRPVDEIAQGLRVSQDLSVAILYDFSKSDLEDPHATTIQDLIDDIATAKSITSAEAEKFVKYNPDFDDITPQVYNPTNLYGDNNETEEFNGF